MNKYQKGQLYVQTIGCNYNSAHLLQKKLSGNTPPNYTRHILVGLSKTTMLIHQISDLLLVLLHGLLVINDTFNNITVSLWQLVLLVGKTEVFGEKNLNKLYHIKVILSRANNRRQSNSQT